MDKNLRLKITVETTDDDAKFKLGAFIHSQLKGNPDYIENNIILNIDTKNTVELYVFKECTIPTVALKLLLPDNTKEEKSHEVTTPLLNTVESKERGEKISTLLEEIDTYAKETRE